MMQGFDIEVRDTPFDPESSERSVYYQKGERVLYRIYLHLAGKDLPFVKQVTYHLHPTFEQRVRTVPRTLANPLCKLVLRAWGVFEVAVEIVDLKGNTHQRTHFLTYDQYFDQQRFKAEKLTLREG